MGEAQNDCMAHAEMAIFRSGFDKSDPGSQSMSGKHGEYTASIRCIAEQRIVFFVTAGPSAESDGTLSGRVVRALLRSRRRQHGKRPARAAQRELFGISRPR